MYFCLLIASPVHEGFFFFFFTFFALIRVIDLVRRRTDGSSESARATMQADPDEIFDMFDQDGSGLIELKELHDMFHVCISTKLPKRSVMANFMQSVTSGLPVPSKYFCAISTETRHQGKR